MKICLYGASSPDIDQSYIAAVEELGARWQSVDTAWFTAVAQTV